MEVDFRSRKEKQNSILTYKIFPAVVIPPNHDSHIWKKFWIFIHRENQGALQKSKYIFSLTFLLDFELHLTKSFFKQSGKMQTWLQLK